jgi:hypothetical protein
VIRGTRRCRGRVSARCRSAGFATDDLNRVGATFLDAALGVTRLLQRIVTEQDMDTQRRQLTSLRRGDHLAVRGDVLRAGVLDIDVDESGSAESLDGVLWCGQPLTGAVLRPRQRVVRVADGTEPVLGEPEERARLEHPERLGEELGPVRDVHRDVLGVGAVERLAPVRQGEGVALLDADLAGHSQQRSQLVGRIDEWAGDIHPADPAAEPLREVPRRSAYPAADIQNVVGGFDGQVIGEVDGGGEPAGVEVIHRG